MRLVTLEGSSQTTSSQLVLGKGMVNRVDACRAEEGSPARAEEEIGRSGDARHPGKLQWNDRQKKRRKERKRSRLASQEVVSPVPKILGALSHRPTNQERQFIYQ